MGQSQSTYEPSLEFARALDQRDPLREFRGRFLFPKTKTGDDALYFCGNSLGLPPRSARTLIEQELEDWAQLGVEGHVHARKPWLPYHENVTASLGRLVGGRTSEVVAMNSLTVNLHLMMTSFYRPEGRRGKILVESGAFPSDQYAVASQARLHGLDPKDVIVELRPRKGELTLRPEDVLTAIERQGQEIALILIGNVNYLTGQAFDMKAITEAGHHQGCRVGFDLAHGAGNLLCNLHEWNVDFAVWCSYKYLNSGPGAIGGCFVHERHGHDRSLPKLCGWWGQNKATRFEMGPDFDPIEGVEGWQLSNPPIFQLAALRASLEIFDEAGMDRIRAKAERLTGYLEYWLDRISANPASGMPAFSQITPRDPAQRGCHLSIRILPQAQGDARAFLKRLGEAGVIADFREPDVIRLAPAPLYNSFEDVYRLAGLLGAGA